MNINMEIPAPSPESEKAVPIGYDIPRDTISRDFIKSTRTARQHSSLSATSDGFQQYLIPSTSNSPTKLGGESPRIVVYSPDDDVFASSLKYHHDSPKAKRSSWTGADLEAPIESKDPRRTHNRSLIVACAAAAVVLIIVIFFIVLLIYD